MTHNFKTGVTYKTRGGRKVWFVGEASNKGLFPLAFEDENGSIASYTMLGTYWEDATSDYDIIGPWQDEPEQIDVSNMWVHIHEVKGARPHLQCHYQMSFEKTEPVFESTIAIIRVAEWEAIKRGERKLKVGEGL